MSILTRRDMLLATALGTASLTLVQHAWVNRVRWATAGGAFLYEPWLDRDGIVREAAARGGLAVRKVEGDIGSIAMAYDELWRLERKPLLGLTTPATGFVLQQLAMRRGMAFSIVGHDKSNGHDTDYLSRPRDETKPWLTQGQVWHVR